MILNITMRNCRICLTSLVRRNYSASGNLVNVQKDDATGTSILSMARPPVNSLNRELLVELRESLNKAVQNNSKGVILTSSLPKIFSGGLDIMEMYKPDMKRAREFWNDLQETWMTLYGLTIPTAAAVNGSSPAGGCLFAMACEYRVFVEGMHQIGLNETQLGIVAPIWFQTSYIDTIGYRQSEQALLKGAQFSPQQALKIGLVDELATNKDDAVAKCQKYIESFTNIPAMARVMTKYDLRNKRIAWLKENREADTKRFLDFLALPKVQTAIGLYIQALKQKN
ncbi:hypothetical protein PV328_006106 [Microctonus aethiopoides]|uniref:Enoyl-CoA delta isomerase 1, mitochondrial n=2 Tax=Microctonus aethiopoides TaxID=144406 RepID=A0AA39FNE6_9HYME|nr:hypothetical protein PV328_006106 [Microctonus aethiopoides]